MNNENCNLRQISLGRGAFTLIEMLIAMALTLILVYSVAEFYAYVGNAVRDGRATMEMGGQLRAASQQLHDDLNSLTLRPQPWIDSGASGGYFTVYEGPQSDTYPDGGVSDITADSNGNQIPDLVENNNVTTLVGDGDDVWAGTIQSIKQPFQGQVWNGTSHVPVNSEYAEVVWFTTFEDLNGDGTWNINEPRFLCRRLLLILPNLGILPMESNLAGFIQNAEISFHINAAGQPVANSLADLSFRHNRFGCQVQIPTYPSYLRWNPTNLSTLTQYTFQGPKWGEDRVLANLLAFDIRVFDPTAPVYRSTNQNETAVVPGDPGFPAAATDITNLIGVGAWVDLSYNRTLASGSAASIFSGVPSPAFNLVAPTATPPVPYNFHTWDTWPLAYELSNVGNGPGTGRAFDGQDNDNANGVDDVGERQTAPPYSAPLRGIQVRLRIYEPQTRQARQVTVGADFIPD